MDMENYFEKIILLSHNPKSTNNMHKTLFIKIFSMAYLIFPFKKYCTVSSEYAEKVV